MEKNIPSEKYLLVVQARTGSSRLPEKVLKTVLGRSILYRMVERLRRITFPVEILVATSTEKNDDAIEKECENMGLPCFRGSLRNLLDRHYQAALTYKADWVFKIPSDCPLIDPTIIEKAIEISQTPHCPFDYISNLHPASWPDGNDVELMRFSCLEKAWKEASLDLELEHTTPYIWENPEKFLIGNFSSGKEDLSRKFRFTLDYIEDYHFIERVYEALYPGNPNFSCEDILDFLKIHPEVFELNAHYLGEYWYKNHPGQLKNI